MAHLLNQASFVILLAFSLSHCGVNSRPSRGARGTEVVNVSAYDPKEKQRSGRSYSPSDVSALRDNGAAGLIARTGKGGELDEKCATFLTASDRVGMLIGVYYRTTKNKSVHTQADQFVNRAQQLAQSRNWNQQRLLLCADFDAESSPAEMIQFLDHVKSRTGVDCMVYLENSEHLRVTLHNASDSVKNRLRMCPYWAALYSHDSGRCAAFPVPGTPTGLTKQYNVWSNWSLWQYGGVNWENGRSSPKVYRGFSPYFGNIDRPLERNLFRGNREQLTLLWNRHGIPLR